MMKRKYQDDEKLSPVLRKIIWLFGTARNAVVVIVAALVAFVVDNKNIEFWEKFYKNRSKFWHCFWKRLAPKNQQKP